MKTVSFSTVKGGVGKTCISLQTAKILSENYKVLMIDMDPQSAATAHLVTRQVDYTIRNVIGEDKPVSETVIHVDNNFDFIPSEIDLSFVEIDMASTPNSSFVLYQKLNDPLLSDIVGDYDYCIIDSPPAVGLLMNSAIIASDMTVIPTQLESWSVRGIVPTQKAIAKCRRSKSLVNKGIDEMIVSNMYDNRSVKNSFLEKLKTDYSDILYPYPISLKSDISATFSQAGHFLPENTKSYEEFKGFVDHLLGVLNGK
ncbi:MAG: AAA family ATPase [Brevinematales bacterium]|nr:AAA family ATPase [Brevinematales bacterium]